MSQVTALDCGISCCGNSQATQTNLSLVLRIAGVALGILALGGSALLFHFRYDLRVVAACAAVGAMTTALSIFMRQIPLSKGQASHQVASQAIVKAHEEKPKLPQKEYFELNGIVAYRLPAIYPLANGNLLVVEAGSLATTIKIYNADGECVEKGSFEDVTASHILDGHIYLGQKGGSIVKITPHATGYQWECVRDKQDEEVWVSRISSDSQGSLIARLSDGTIWVKPMLLTAKDYNQLQHQQIKELEYDKGVLFYCCDGFDVIITAPCTEVPDQYINLDKKFRSLKVAGDKLLILQTEQHPYKFGTGKSQILVYKIGEYKQAIATIDIEEPAYPNTTHLQCVANKIFFVGADRVYAWNEGGKLLKDDFAVVSSEKEKLKILRTQVVGEYLMTEHRDPFGKNILSIWNMNSFALESQTAIEDDKDGQFCQVGAGYVARRAANKLTVWKFDPKHTPFGDKK